MNSPMGTGSRRSPNPHDSRSGLGAGWPIFESNERVFSALADTTRRRLLANLAESSPKTATQLAQEFPITRQGIMKHLKLLVEAGLAQTQSRGREKQYSFTPEPLQDVSGWIEAIETKWDTRLQRLKAMVEEEGL